MMGKKNGGIQGHFTQWQPTQGWIYSHCQDKEDWAAHSNILNLSEVHFNIFEQLQKPKFLVPWEFFEVSRVQNHMQL